MKNIILFITILIITSNLFHAKAYDISPKAKVLIFQAISEYVYFEDEGFERMPQNSEDFTFAVTNEFEIQIHGSSYSEWDMKKIDYHCVISINTRGMIESSKDFTLESCELENENWPYL